jgi:hypothetical protein
MSPTLSKGRIRWALGFAALLVVGLLTIWQVRQRRGQQSETQTDATRLAMPLSHNAPLSSAPSPNATPQTPNAGQTSVDVCGARVAGPPQQPTESSEQYAIRLTNSTLGRWKSQLARSDDPRMRAVGLALDSARLGPPAELAAVSDTPANTDLVLLALQTRDPVVYALAVGQCRLASGELTAGPCQGLSLTEWAALDSENAVPWLWIAVRANASGNVSRVEDALEHAARAARVVTYGPGLGSAALAALPQDASPLDKAVAGSEIFGIPLVAAPIELVTSVCSEATIEAPKRRTHCEAIASLISENPTSLFQAAIASDLRRRLGWSDDHWGPIEAEFRDARSRVTRMAHPWGRVPPDPVIGCDSVSGYARYIDQYVAFGGNALLAIRAMPESKPPNREGSSVSDPRP